jgi:CubicO group peptidase (beta-lactamase class C family)
LKLVDQEIGSSVGFGHDGDLGQYLIVMPHPGIVAVRLHEEQGSLPGTSWPTFLTDVLHSLQRGKVLSDFDGCE